MAARAACAIGVIVGALSARPSAGDDGLMTTIGRLDAVPGTTVVLPVVPIGARLDAMLGPPEGWVPGSFPGVTMSGQRVEAWLYRLDGDRATDAWVGAWLPAPFVWRATPYEEVVEGGAPAGEVSFWAVAADLPEQPTSRYLDIGPQRLLVNWLEAPPQRTETARLPLLDAPVEARRRLGDQLRREGADVFRRWRCSIVADRFEGRGLWGEGPGLETPRDPVLAAAARHAETRARAAIEVVRRIDADLAARLVSMLTGVVSTPGPTPDLLPAWPADDAATQDLFSQLLDPRRSSRGKKQDVIAWLDRHPQALVWIVDDFDALPGSGERSVVVGIANMTGSRAVCSAAPEGEPARNATLVLPQRIAYLSTPRRDQAGRVVARVGDRSYPLTVVMATPLASPPGIDLGPLSPDWSMATWLGPSVPLGNPAWGTVARLYAEPTGADGDRVWRVMIEALVGEGFGDAGDVVRLWFGPRSETRGTIEVSSSGAAIARVDGRGEEMAARFSRGDDRWTAIIDVPWWAIEGGGDETGGVVHVGVERIDGRGVRTSWPRPMLGNQSSPSRLRIDLGAWSPLDERDP